MKMTLIVGLRFSLWLKRQKSVLLPLNTLGMYVDCHACMFCNHFKVDFTVDLSPAWSLKVLCVIP